MNQCVGGFQVTITLGHTKQQHILSSAKAVYISDI